jgi:succinyl-CoA synthetase alpha subunit
MSSPYDSIETINAAHGAHALVISPHVTTAIWAIVLAIACALVVIIAEMVKQRNEAEVKRRRGKTPPS